MKAWRLGVFILDIEEKEKMKIDVFSHFLPSHVEEMPVILCSF